MDGMGHRLLLLLEHRSQSGANKIYWHFISHSMRGSSVEFEREFSGPSCRKVKLPKPFQAFVNGASKDFCLAPSDPVFSQASLKRFFFKILTWPLAIQFLTGDFERVNMTQPLITPLSPYSNLYTNFWMKSDVKAIKKAWAKILLFNLIFEDWSHIADNRELSQHLKDLEPDSNVFCSLRHSTSGVTVFI